MQLTTIAENSDFICHVDDHSTGYLTHSIIVLVDPVSMHPNHMHDA